MSEVTVRSGGVAEMWKKGGGEEPVEEGGEEERAPRRGGRAPGRLSRSAGGKERAGRLCEVEEGPAHFLGG